MHTFFYGLVTQGQRKQITFIMYYKNLSAQSSDIQDSFTYVFYIFATEPHDMQEKCTEMIKVIGVSKYM